MGDQFDFTLFIDGAASLTAAGSAPAVQPVMWKPDQKYVFDYTPLPAKPPKRRGARTRSLFASTSTKAPDIAPPPSAPPANTKVSSGVAPHRAPSIAEAQQRPGGIAEAQQELRSGLQLVAHLSKLTKYCSTSARSGCVRIPPARGKWLAQA